ncbi:MAG: DNA alkylation repair protein [Candidatus Latescibacteria bacterium]|nr:DNA alkylation repair protein [Candidatus Latescibacterota bacterium]
MAIDVKREQYHKCLLEVDKVITQSVKNIPSLRRFAKHKYSFSNQPFREQIFIWDYIWKNADNWWTKIQAYYYCEQYTHKETELLSSWKIIKTWQDYVTGWGECDALAKLYTKILEVLPKSVLLTLQRWNKSSNQWKRRQSVVSLLYFQRTKKKFLPFNKIIPLIGNLLDDKDYYVQKGVGWTLKELYQVYPKPTYEYIKKNIKKIKPEAYSHTVEKLTLKEKQELKHLRKI